MDDFLGFLIMVILLLGVVFGGMIASVYFVGGYQCSAYRKTTGHQTQFVALECYVKDQGQWYVWEEYKNRLVAKGDMAKGEK